MGTNYYARKNICKCCGRYNDEHIGKSAYGWKFTFHSTENIKSYREWVKELSKKDVLIFDEYGEQMPLDKFKEMVESKQTEKHEQTDYGSDTFKDYEGYCFSSSEFC